MPQVKRTTKEPNKPDQVEIFSLPGLTKNVVGRGVNNKVIYDLKKRKRSEVKLADGTELIFEVL